MGAAMECAAYGEGSEKGTGSIDGGVVELDRAAGAGVGAW